MSLAYVVLRAVIGKMSISMLVGKEKEAPLISFLISTVVIDDTYVTFIKKNECSFLGRNVGVARREMVFDSSPIDQRRVFPMY